MNLSKGVNLTKPARGKKALRKYKFQFGRALRYLDDDDDGGNQCFVAGTSVVMADGSKISIEKIKKGDIVLSRDAKTGKTAAKRVVRTFEKQAPATLVLHFKGGQKVETTLEHPFYVESKGFTAAKELGIGTSIVTRAGPSAILERVERKDAPATVYNFEVEDFHTYFVGDGLWVHNDCESITVIGRMKHVVLFEDKEGIRTWPRNDASMNGSNFQWKKNREWIDEGIAKGHEFWLATPEADLGATPASDGTGNGWYTFRELRHLRSRGIEPLKVYPDGEDHWGTYEYGVEYPDNWRTYP